MLGAIMFRRDLFSEIEAKPDLYGPFWICTTIVFLMAMISNAIDWMANRNTNDVWQSDLQKLVYGAAVLYGYVFGAGVVLWVWLKVISLAAMSLSALWCIYGMHPPLCQSFVLVCARTHSCCCSLEHAWSRAGRVASGSCPQGIGASMRMSCSFHRQEVLPRLISWLRVAR
jgi:hypothetical protein